jgi:hypothetical protein
VKHTTRINYVIRLLKHFRGNVLVAICQPVHLSDVGFLSCGFAVMQFFASDQRIKAVRQMIMATTTAQRQVALDKLLPYQRSDFEGIFRVMDGMLLFL